MSNTAWRLIDAEGVDHDGVTTITLALQANSKCYIVGITGQPTLTAAEVLNSLRAAVAHYSRACGVNLPDGCRSMEPNETTPNGRVQ